MDGTVGQGPDVVCWRVWDAQLDGPEPVAPLDPDLPVVRPADPIDLVVAAMRTVDREMAAVLRAIAAAGPAEGLPARRHVALRAQVTGVDVGFLDRAVQTLQAMPLTWQAFDDGRLSWSQLRAIVSEARRLTVALRGVLDALMVAVIDRAATGEPDRVGETCGDLVARLDTARAETDEATVERAERLVMQLGFDGWARLYGDLAPDTAATVAEALDDAADPPVAPDAPPVTDDDGTVLPTAAQPVRSRARQWAEALHRISVAHLSGGAGGRARPSLLLVASLTDLLGEDVAAPGAGDASTRPPSTAATGRTEADPADDGPGVGSVVSRLLLRTSTGRRRITRALTRRLAQDADIIPLLTDATGTPVAIGDSHSPITSAMRRAVIARDQGCRTPGCTTPVQHCDLHHVIPRHQGGPTSTDNLVAICRPHHTALSRHHWTMQLDPDGTLHTRIGRRRYTTRPRLHPPPPIPPDRPPDPPADSPF